MNTVSIMTFEGNRSPLNVCVVCIRIGGVRVSGMNELCCFDMHSCILFHSIVRSRGQKGYHHFVMALVKAGQ